MAKFTSVPAPYVAALCVKPSVKLSPNTTAVVPPTKPCCSVLAASTAMLAANWSEIPGIFATVAVILVTASVYAFFPIGVSTKKSPTASVTP